MKVTFQVCANAESVSPSKEDFQLGETVYLRLQADFYHGEDAPLIANNTIFVVYDESGTAVWNFSSNQFGGGWFAPYAGGEGDVAASTARIIQWTPDEAGNYSSGVIFEETSYPNNFSKVMSFRVNAPSQSNDSAKTDTAETQLPVQEPTTPEGNSVIPVAAASAMTMVTFAIADLLVYFKKRRGSKNP